MKWYWGVIAALAALVALTGLWGRSEASKVQSGLEREKALTEALESSQAALAMQKQVRVADEASGKVRVEYITKVEKVYVDKSEELAEAAKANPAWADATIPDDVLRVLR